MKGLKGGNDEGSLRVPFFISWKGKLHENKTLQQVASQIDVFPTLLEIAGGELPDNQVEGRSFASLLVDAEAAWPDRYLFDHCGRWPLQAEPNDFQWKQFTVRNTRYRLVGKDLLYDMQEDPGQTKNCAEQNPELVAKMIAAYDSWWKESRPLMVNEHRGLSKTKPFHELFNQQQKDGMINDWNEN